MSCPAVSGQKTAKRSWPSHTRASCWYRCVSLTLMPSRVHTPRTVCRFFSRLLSITHMVSWPFFIWVRASSSLRAPDLWLGEDWPTTHVQLYSHHQSCRENLKTLTRALTGRKSATFSPMGSFRALEMILSCGLDLAVVTGGWVGAGWLEDTVPAAGGDGRFTAEMTVGSTLTTGVEAASGGPFKTTDTSSHSLYSLISAGFMGIWFLEKLLIMTEIRNYYKIISHTSF